MLQISICDHFLIGGLQIILEYGGGKNKLNLPSDAFFDLFRIGVH